MKKGTTTVLATLFGAVSGAGAVYMQMNKKVKSSKNMDRKNDAILKVYSQWLSLRQEGKSIADYLKENSYKKIAIYGMHYLGESLYDELKDTDIEIKYAIDKNANNLLHDIEIYPPNEELEQLEEIDAVIVTAFFFYNEIEENLSRYLDCPIISIEDILYEM